MLENIKSLFDKRVLKQVEHFDYFLSDITNVLKLFGIDFWSADWKLRKAKRLILPIFFISLYAFVFEFFYFIFYQDEPGVIVKSLFVSIGAGTFLIKLTLTFWYRKTIIELLGKIKNDFWSYHEESWLKKKILIAGSKKMKFFVRIYFGLYFLGVIAMVTRPIIAVLFFAKFESPMPVTIPGD